MRPSRLRRTATFGALAAASLLVAHDTVFLVQLGPGEALTRALRAGGHGYWAAASAVIAGLALLAILGIAVRLAGLRRRATGLRVEPGTSRSRLTLTLRLWLRLLLVVAAGFTIQENIEHLLGHEHFIGLGALHGPEYPLGLPVLALVTLVASAIGAAVLGVERRLLAAIAAPIRRRHPPRAMPRPPRDAVAVRRSPMAGNAAGRAPPAFVCQPIG